MPNAETKKGLSRQSETGTEKTIGKAERASTNALSVQFVWTGTKTTREGKGDGRSIRGNAAFLLCITSVKAQELSRLNSFAVRVETYKHVKDDSVKHSTSGVVVEKTAIAAANLCQRRVSQVAHLLRGKCSFELECMK